MLVLFYNEKFIFIYTSTQKFHMRNRSTTLIQLYGIFKKLNRNILYNSISQWSVNGSQTAKFELWRLIGLHIDVVIPYRHLNFFYCTLKRFYCMTQSKFTFKWLLEEIRISSFIGTHTLKLCKLYAKRNSIARHKTITFEHWLFHTSSTPKNKDKFMLTITLPR